MVDYLPDHFVVLHGGKFIGCCCVIILGAVCGCVVVYINWCWQYSMVFGASLSKIISN